MYDKELIKYIESIPYGVVDVRIERTNRKTVKIITTAEETLRYVDNDEALMDLKNMLDNLINTGFSGEAHVKLSMKDGQINLLSIFDKKETLYK